MRSVGVALIATLLIGTTSMAMADVKVVASIKPIHSLVSSVMQGVGTPDLIVEGAGSPHNYSLKPSQAKKLQEADVVFWMSHDLEAFLEKSIEGIATKAKTVSLMDSHDLIKLSFREGGAFDDHGHEEEGHDDHGQGEGGHAFEWAGIFDLSAGSYKWSFAKVGGDYADPAMKMVILEASGIEPSEELAEELLEANESEKKTNNQRLLAKEKAYSLNFDETENKTVFTVSIKKNGKYAFFTEHMPFEFEADEHFFKDASGADIEPIEQEPDMGSHEEHAHHDEHGHGAFDPHVWLDPVNAKAIVHEIEEALSEVDPVNSATYSKNAKAVMQKLDKLVVEIGAQLQPIKGSGYVVFHDAYQYFEQRFGVSAIGSITVSPEVLPGAERVSKLREKVKSLNATCVFSEPQFEPKIVTTIVENTNSGTGVLDPLGAEISDGPDLYFTLVRNIASSLENCLS